ncbi:MAG: putative nicotinamide nucleotide transporter [Parcubacteria bacterium C7867-005]|nr:MAG: putative nicotinamide nucleotide transporter [Parcubacteria bacterium C7867-005]
MNFYVAIEIIGSLVYLTQKILLSFSKRVGWVLGIMGSAAFATVTFHKGSYAYGILEVTSGIIFFFGLILWGKSGAKEKWMTFAMSTVAILGIILVSVLNLGSPNWILETLVVILFAIGAIFLVLKKPIGWFLYGLGHLVLTIYAYQLGTYYIMILQVVSLPFAFIGYRRFGLVNLVRYY